MISVFLLADTEDAFIFEVIYICLIITADCCLVFRLSFNFECKAAVQEFAELSDKKTFEQTVWSGGG